ncbi:MAG: ureidoglycolate lyase [Clostridia bacterium]|nr:ureidoglycolate lyase [Clostridia bacterium]
MATKEIIVPVFKPTPENFKPFGAILKAPRVAPSVDIPGVLNYWDEVANLNHGKCQPELGFLTTMFRPFDFCEMERHVHSDEAFIPLENKAFIFALAPACDPADPSAMPDPSKVVAFIIDGSFGVNLNVGVWHWAPFPLADRINLVLALRRGTPAEDIDMFNFSEKLGVTFKIAL